MFHRHVTLAVESSLAPAMREEPRSLKVLFFEVYDSWPQSLFLSFSTSSVSTQICSRMELRLATSVVFTFIAKFWGRAQSGPPRNIHQRRAFLGHDLGKSKPPELPHHCKCVLWLRLQILPPPLALGRTKVADLTRLTAAHVNISAETIVPEVGVGFSIADEHDATFAVP